MAACGDNGPITTDAARTTPDARVDAATCDTAGYPPSVTFEQFQVFPDVVLALDGVGPLCEQQLRAITDPRAPLPELAPIDFGGATATCFPGPSQDQIDIRVPRFAGLPLLERDQQVVGLIDHERRLVLLQGFYLTAPTPAAACLDPIAVRERVIGAAMTSQSCDTFEPLAYSIAANDVITVGAEAFVSDGLRMLRIRVLDVDVLPSHASASLLRTDAYCCPAGPALGCIGRRMFVDAVTGAIVGQRARCGCEHVPPLP